MIMSSSKNLSKILGMGILYVFFAQFLTIQNASACNDGRFFLHCQDQNEIYQAALAQAKSEQKTLVVVVGYEACVWCGSLGTIFKNFVEENGAMAHDFVFAPIAAFYYNIGQEKFEKIPSGLAVSAQLLSQLSVPQEISGYPTIFAINPENNKTLMFQTSDLEENDSVREIYGHDLGKVIGLLREAQATLATPISLASLRCSDITAD